MKSILITGIAGFIGFHLANELIKKKYKLIGIDNLNNYYDVNLKKKRLNIIKKKIIFYKTDLSDNKKLEEIFKKHKPSYVINLAAQAGVRYSLKYPRKYLNSNIIGFFNILELSRVYKVKHFLFASSSSVYGLNSKFPFKETQDTSRQTNIYGVTKKTNELMAHSYSYLFNMNCTGLRYFTVYGPWGRPDMSLFLFVKNIINKKKIEVFNEGKMYRDFTYIDDAIKSTISLIKNTSYNKKKIPFEIINISNSKPVKLMKFIQIIEKNLQKKAIIQFKNNLKTEIRKTHGDEKKLNKRINPFQRTTIEIGVNKFINWYKNYYQIR